MNFQRVLKHPLFRGGIIYALTDAINKAVPFLILPLLTYYLTPSDYGIVANYTVYTSILLVFVGINLHGAISVNFYKLEKERIAEYLFNLFVILVVSTALSFVLIWALGGIVTNFLPVGMAYLFLGIVITFAQIVTMFNMELWRLEEKPLKFGIYQISQTIFNFLLTLWFVIGLSAKWEGRVWAIAIATLCYGVFSIVFIWKRGYLKTVYNLEYVKDALRFGVPLLPYALSIWIRTGIDRIFLTHFFGTGSTGLYATGFQFGLLLTFLNMAFNNAYIPYLYKNLERPDNGSLKRKLVLFTYAYMIIQLILAVFFTFASYIVVDHLLAESYRESKIFIGWAMLAQAFQGMYLMTGCYYFYAKKTKFLAYITFSSAIVQLGTSYFFIRNFGAIGAAYSATLMSFLTFVIVWMFSNKAYEMPWFINFKKISKA